MEKLTVCFEFEDTVMKTAIEIDFPEELESDAIDKAFKKMQDKYGVTFDMDECEDISVHPFD